MKGSLWVAIMLFSNTVGAQDTLVTYLDKGERPSGKELAGHYRKSVFKDGIWFVDQYSVADNHLEMSGSYKAIDTIREGLFTVYYPNGFKQSEGYYLDNIQVGSWTTWYPNGKMDSKEFFLNDMEDIVGVIERDSVIRSQYKNQSKRHGYNGIRHGLSTFYYGNGQESAKEIYKHGRIMSAKFWNAQGGIEMKEIKDVYENTTFPQFNGDVSKFIAKNMVYPQAAIKQGIHGKEVIQFAVDIDGSIVDYEIKKSLGSKEIDEEAIRVIRLLNHKFTPGLSHNRIVKIYFTLPINFQ